MSARYKVFEDRPQTHAEANVRYRAKRLAVLEAARDYVHAKEVDNREATDAAWARLQEATNALYPPRITPPVRSPEFWAWSNMRARCSNPDDPRYDDYGGRGITVCERWQNSFFAFFEDMGPRPTPDHSLDRENNDRGYEPGNCRWATRKEQAWNRRNTRLVELDGEMVTLREASRRLSIPETTIQARIDRGLPKERWFEKPRPRRQRALP